MKQSRIGSISALGSVALLVAACAGGAGPPAPTAALPTTSPPTTAPPTTAPQTETKSAAQTETKSETKAAAGSGKATGEPIKIGSLCDRSGATATVTPFLCDG